MRRHRLAALALLCLAQQTLAALPPVPVPAENPITEQKRVLGKALFWDEQLSTNGTVACGTCHRPGSGGADPRAGRNPGGDKGTIDDVRGSPGIVFLDREGKPQPHPVYGNAPQVTPRLAPSNFGALWAEQVFWDGRAGAVVKDPVNGEVAIARGGALENQVLSALLNPGEMAKTGRTWTDLVADVTNARPLALATALPPDVAAAITTAPTYAKLFTTAFGDSAITPTRIAFAIAAYERTLIADQTAWDLYDAGDAAALSARAASGWRAMQAFHCTACHTPPLFTSNKFFQIGLRKVEFDRGRENVTHDPKDAGAMKVPSLRNAALRARFMHTGEFTNLGSAIRFYQNSIPLPERSDIPGFGIYAFNVSQIDEADIREFLTAGLTDPRVRDEVFPFDRPKLRSERESQHAVGTQ